MAVVSPVKDVPLVAGYSFAQCYNCCNWRIIKDRTTERFFLCCDGKGVMFKPSQLPEKIFHEIARGSRSGFNELKWARCIECHQWRCLNAFIRTPTSKTANKIQSFFHCSAIDLTCQHAGVPEEIKEFIADSELNEVLYREAEEVDGDFPEAAAGSGGARKRKLARSEEEYYLKRKRTLQGVISETELPVPVPREEYVTTLSEGVLVNPLDLLCEKEAGINFKLVKIREEVLRLQRDLFHYTSQIKGCLKRKAELEEKRNWLQREGQDITVLQGNLQNQAAVLKEAKDLWSADEDNNISMVLQLADSALSLSEVEACIGNVAAMRFSSKELFQGYIMEYRRYQDARRKIHHEKTRLKHIAGTEAAMRLLQEALEGLYDKKIEAETKVQELSKERDEQQRFLKEYAKIKQERGKAEIRRYYAMELPELGALLRRQDRSLRRSRVLLNEFETGRVAAKKWGRQPHYTEEDARRERGVEMLSLRSNIKRLENERWRLANVYFYKIKDTSKVPKVEVLAAAKIS
jgi:hypothetical protein